MDECTEHHARWEAAHEELAQMRAEQGLQTNDATVQTSTED